AVVVRGELRLPRRGRGFGVGVVTVITVEPEPATEGARQPTRPEMFVQPSRKVPVDLDQIDGKLFGLGLKPRKLGLPLGTLFRFCVCSCVWSALLRAMLAVPLPGPPFPCRLGGELVNGCGLLLGIGGGDLQKLGLVVVDASVLRSLLGGRRDLGDLGGALN